MLVVGVFMGMMGSGCVASHAEEVALDGVWQPIAGEISIECGGRQFDIPAKSPIHIIRQDGKILVSGDSCALRYVNVDGGVAEGASGQMCVALLEHQRRLVMSVATSTVTRTSGGRIRQTVVGSASIAGEPGFRDCAIRGSAEYERVPHE